MMKTAKNHLRSWQQVGIFLSLVFFFSQAGLIFWSLQQPVPTNDPSFSNHLMTLHLIVGFSTLVTMAGSWIFFRWGYDRAESHFNKLSSKLAQFKQSNDQNRVVVSPQATQAVSTKSPSQTAKVPPHKVAMIGAKKKLEKPKTPLSSMPRPSITKSSAGPYRPMTASKNTQPAIPASDLIPFDDDGPSLLSRAEDF